MKLKIKNDYFDIHIAESFYDRMMGFMGKQNITYGILFPKCNSIHTFFMKENIDVVGLNEKKEIIFLEANVSKNKIIKIHSPLKKTSILELPQNTSLSFHLGDTLFFEFENIV